MYEIKTHPEDFIVNEIIDLDLKPEKTSNYKYAILKLTKKNIATMDAVYKIAKKFFINAKSFGINGLKDKNGITSQYISLDRFSPNMLTMQVDPLIKLEFVGYSKETLNLGKLKENQFEITIRNLDKDKLNQVRERLKLMKQSFIDNGLIFYPNYYDTQRFSNNNVSQGLHIIKKQFKLFIENLMKYQNSKFNFDDIDENEYRDYEKQVAKELNKNNKDYLRAIQKINGKMLKIYLHSLQSFIFNAIIEIIIKYKFEETSKINKKLGDGFELSFIFPKIVDVCQQIKVPLIGYDPHLLNDFYKSLNDEKLSKKINDYINNFFNIFEIDQRSFIVSELPTVSLEGDYRNIYASAKDFNYEFSEDTLKLNFVLTKGSYATMFVKYIMLE